MNRRIILVNIGSGLSLSGVLPSVALYSDYSAKLNARGGQAPYTFTLVGGALPDGLFLDPSTGFISGTANSAGSASFIARVTDLSGSFVDRHLVITVIADPLSLSGHAPDGTIGIAYTYSYTSTGGVPPRYFSIVSGSLPAGLMLNSVTGELSGTPTTGGAFAWTVRVSDSDGSIFDLADSLSVAYVTLSLTGTYASATVGAAYSSDLTISGGDGAYSNPRVTLGTLPAWATLSIVSGKLRISGTPTGSATTVNITVAVDSADGQTATSAQSVVVATPAWYVPLFASDEQGWIFDFNDLSTMYQDTSHTIPVTATGQTVGAIQCKKTGTFAVLQATSTSVLGYDAGRGLYYVTLDGTSGYKAGPSPPGLLGSNSKTVMTACELSSGSDWYPCVMNDGVGGTLNQFVLGNLNSGGRKTTLYLGGGSNGVLGALQNGIGFYTGTWNSNRNIAIWSGSTKITNPSTYTAGVGSMTLGILSIGVLMASARMYSIVLLNRVVSDTEIADASGSAL